MSGGISSTDCGSARLRPHAGFEPESRSTRRSTDGERCEKSLGVGVAPREAEGTRGNDCGCDCTYSAPLRDADGIHGNPFWPLFWELEHIEVDISIGISPWCPSPPLAFLRIGDTDPLTGVTERPFALPNSIALCSELSRGSVFYIIPRPCILNTMKTPTMRIHDGFIGIPQCSESTGMP